MKDDILSRALRIGNVRAAAAFSDPLRRRLVLLLARQEHSIAEIAKATGLEIKRLHYHITSLQKLGLLVVTRRRRRAGRPIKFYRAKAESFFVPEDMLSESPSDALAVALRDSLARNRDPSREGVLYYLNNDGQPQMRVVQNAPEKNASCAEQWRTLRLSRVDVQRLFADVNECLTSYSSRQSDGAQTYLVHFAFAPSALPVLRKSRAP